MSEAVPADDLAVGNRLQYLFQATSDRVMAVMQEAARQARTPGNRGQVAQEALREIAEITRIVSLADEGWLNFCDGFKIVDELDTIGRRVAAGLGVV